MSTSAVYFNAPDLTVTGTPATANTNLDGTGTITQVAAGVAAPGKRIARATVSAAGATASNRMSFFLSVDNGSTWKFFCDVLIPSASVSSTVRAPAVDVPELAGVLLTGTTHLLGAAPHAAQVQNVTIEWATG